MEQLPENWRTFLCGFCDDAALEATLAELETRRRSECVYPPSGAVFHALELTPPEAVRVVLLGQDPYHGKGQAQGLAFSVPEGEKLPPSLRNIYKEYASDLSRSIPRCGDLSNWAAHGVLLLNAVLSVAEHQPGSHRKLGWEHFSDSVISALSAKKEHLVFLLWGAFAQEKLPLIDRARHTVISCAHPSPLSAHHGFFGSRPFSRAEQALGDWSWPE